MPDRPKPESWGYPPFGDGDLDAWLAGNTAVTPPAVDDALSALLAPPSSAEMANEYRALAEFRRVRRRRSGSPMWFASAAALIIVAIFGAAAVTGRLPTPIQNIAHVVFTDHDSQKPEPARSADPVRSVSGSVSGIAPSRQPTRADTPPGFRSTVPFSRPSSTSCGDTPWNGGKGCQSGSGSGGSGSGSGSGSGGSGSGSGGSGSGGSGFSGSGSGSDSGSGSGGTGSDSGSGSGGSGPTGSGSGSGSASGSGGSGGSGSGWSGWSGGSGSGGSGSGSGGSGSGSGGTGGSGSGSGGSGSGG